MIITAGTYLKKKILATDAHKQIVQDHLFETLLDADWRLEAWAILDNHYHIVAVLPENANVGLTMGAIHRCSARDLNKLDDQPGRKVWHQYWDSAITHERSYLARLAYVHQNPIRHCLVRRAEDYPFCSMNWLITRSDPAFVHTILSFPIDRVNVLDDF